VNTITLSYTLFDVTADQSEQVLSAASVSMASSVNTATL